MAKTKQQEKQGQVQQIWIEYKKNPTQNLRNQLMENYLPLVKYNAQRVFAKLPDSVDIDDLFSAGLFGLMSAIKSFDLSRNIKFETFCAPRIRGAMLDELRSTDWVPRLVRSRTSKVNSARKSLEMQLGRAPDEDELMERMQVSREEYSKIKKDSEAVSMVSLSRKWFESDSNRDICEIDTIKDRKQTNPLAEVSKADLKNVLTKNLSRSERLVIILYYYEQMSMKEIGLTLDISESRVSQMHSSIISRLKAKFQTRKEELQMQVA